MMISVLCFGLKMFGWADETGAIVSPKEEAVPVVSKEVVADVAPAESKTVEPLAPAKAETPETSAEPSSEVAGTAKPDDVGEITAPVVEAVVPVADVEVVKTEETPKASRPVVESALPSVDEVPQVQEIIEFHEKEIASLQKFRDAWNKTLGSLRKKHQDIEKKIADNQEKMATLKYESTKASRVQAKSLKKETHLLTQSLKLLDRDLDKQRKTLVEDLRKISSEAGQGLEETYRQAVKDIQGKP